MDDLIGKVRRFRIPPDAEELLGVYVNGVPQMIGKDYDLDGQALTFTRVLRRRKGLGTVDKLLIALCASVEVEGDSVDAILVSGGRKTVVSLEPA